MKKTIPFTLALLLLWVSPVTAVHVDLPGEVARGQPFWVELESDRQPLGLEISWLDRSFVMPSELPGKQKILLGAGLEREGRQSLELSFYWREHRQKKRYEIEVEDKEYPEQHLTLPEEMVEPPREKRYRIARERQKLTSALNSFRLERYWDGDFSLPVHGEVSSPFGVERYLNEKPRSPHKGVDLQGDKGTPIKSIAAGRATLTGDFYFGGKTVVVDHGQGMHSLYMHLSEIRVQEDEFVQQAELIGEMGMTGRATGPHLHLGTYVLGEAVDPMLLLEEE